jgi:predicted alpha/beta hydrolase family esterase
VTVDVDCLNTSVLFERTKRGEMDLALVTFGCNVQTDEPVRREPLVWVTSARQSTHLTPMVGRDAELSLLHESGPGETIVIGHSLGCVNFLHAAVQGKIKQPIDRLLFVAPADPNLLGEIKGLKVDLGNPATKKAVDAVVRNLTVVGSDADPWTPEGIQETFGTPLGVKAIVIHGAQHFTTEQGWGKWDGLFDWVNNPEADITVR